MKKFLIITATLLLFSTNPISAHQVQLLNNNTISAIESNNSSNDTTFYVLTYIVKGLEKESDALMLDNLMQGNRYISDIETDFYNGIITVVTTDMGNIDKIRESILATRKTSGLVLSVEFIDSKMLK